MPEKTSETVDQWIKCFDPYHLMSPSYRHIDYLTAKKIIEAHLPVGFVGESEDEIISLNEFISLLKKKFVQAEAAGKKAVEELKAAELKEELDYFENSFNMPESDEPVTEGRWEGFTRGEARAWCWNLFKYEVRGIAHPGSQLRYEAIELLKNGDLPEVFGYPERAKQLAERGITAREYRRLKEEVSDSENFLA